MKPSSPFPLPPSFSPRSGDKHNKHNKHQVNITHQIPSHRKTKQPQKRLYEEVREQDMKQTMRYVDCYVIIPPLLPNYYFCAAHHKRGRAAYQQGGENRSNAAGDRLYVIRAQVQHTPNRSTQPPPPPPPPCADLMYSDRSQKYKNTSNHTTYHTHGKQQMKKKADKNQQRALRHLRHC